MPRSVRKATAYRGTTCIHGAARKNGYLMMLREFDITRHMDLTWTIMHTYTRTISDMWRDVHDRTQTTSSHGYGAGRARPALAVHACAVRCPLTQPLRGAARVRQAAACSPRPTLTLRALSQEHRTALSEGRGNGRESARGSGHLCAAAAAGGEDTR